MPPEPAPLPCPALDHVRTRIAAVRHPHGATVRLLAVSKMQPVEAIVALAAAGQRAFGENYVQEAAAKRTALAALGLEWHLIGPLQSNKCRDAAALFDWVQSVDRIKIVEPLARYRPDAAPPLNVLVQVNIENEASKSGCTIHEIDMLADAIAAQPRLRLRGLMAIPAPHADPTARRAAFRAMRQQFDRLRGRYPDIDTLSMGMSDDFELAIADGATMVRVGTALFGARHATP